jgi:DNA/RNA endonuclease G (NUC1)
VLRVKKTEGSVTSATAIGFWMDHRKYDDSYTNYTFSVDQIEQWTGLDYFVNLPDSVEDSAETNSSWDAFRNF